MRYLTCAGVLTLAQAIPAQAIDLTLPVDCKLGETCFIQNYVDADPSDRRADFTCNLLTYDGHKGTDIALPAARDMDVGVPILAAASGTVVGLRDGVREHLPGEPMAFPEGQDCGNGLLIAHEDGWETQCCHLRTGSVTPQTGDYVEAGQQIGEMGMSGRTEFPHLHMILRRDDDVVDPFDPNPDATCGARQEDQLWATPIAYQAGGLIQAGFASAIPEFDTIRIGDAHTAQIAADEGALVLWVHLFGTIEGDVVQFSIEGPQGSFFENTVTLDRTQAQAFRAGGRRLHDGNTIPGQYTGKVTLIRDGQSMGVMTTRTVLTE